MKREFTIVELVAVMAIMMVLTTMLLPALQTARESAYSTHCMSNLRQLCQAMQGYCDDWKGKLASYSSKAPDSEHVGTNWPIWSKPYYQSKDVLVCPASPDDGPEDDTVASLRKYDGHYGWNYDGTQGNRGVLSVHVSRPSQSYLLMDSGDPCIIYGKNNWANLMEELDLDFDSRGEGCNRHRNHTDVGFVDGHCELRLLDVFLAAPCDSYAAPWCMKWEENDGVLLPGVVPFPVRN